MGSSSVPVVRSAPTGLYPRYFCSRNEIEFVSYYRLFGLGGMNLRVSDIDLHLLLAWKTEEPLCGVMDSADQALGYAVILL
jgi:hypothetical protein